MAVQLTAAAVDRVRRFATDETVPGLRFGIRRNGCSGYAYVVDRVGAVQGDDAVFQQDGVRLVVDARSLPVVDGTVIDFVKQGLNASFVFRNPNVTAECGCGESFSVEKDASFG